MHLSRREQQGTEDFQLEGGRGRGGKGKGKGKGRGKGRGKGKRAPKKTDKSQTDVKAMKKSRSKAPVDSKSPQKSPKKTKAKAKAKAEKVSPKKVVKVSPKKVEKVSPKKTKPVKKRPAAGKADSVPPPEGPAPKPARTVARTWAGRWIPEDESSASFRKFQAIRKVFDLYVAPKLVRQSAAQPPFFKVCTAAFREHGVDKDDTTIDQFVATAELEVENFMKMDNTRTLMIFGNRFSSKMPNPKSVCHPEIIWYLAGILTYYNFN